MLALPEVRDSYGETKWLKDRSPPVNPFQSPCQDEDDAQELAGDNQARKNQEYDSASTCSWRHLAPPATRRASKLHQVLPLPHHLLQREQPTTKPNTAAWFQSRSGLTRHNTQALQRSPLVSVMPPRQT